VKGKGKGTVFCSNRLSGNDALYTRAAGGFAQLIEHLGDRQSRRQSRRRRQTTDSLRLL